MRDISRVAVLGSGVMGGAIAAHLANCGIPSLMLDIVPPGLSDEDAKNPAKRNAIALASKKAMIKALLTKEPKRKGAARARGTDSSSPEPEAGG